MWWSFQRHKAKTQTNRKVCPALLMLDFLVKKVRVIRGSLQYISWFLHQDEQQTYSGCCQAELVARKVAMGTYLGGHGLGVLLEVHNGVRDLDVNRVDHHLDVKRSLQLLRQFHQSICKYQKVCVFSTKWIYTWLDDHHLYVKRSFQLLRQFHQRICKYGKVRFFSTKWVLGETITRTRMLVHNLLDSCACMCRKLGVFLVAPCCSQGATLQVTLLTMRCCLSSSLSAW